MTRLRRAVMTRAVGGADLGAVLVEAHIADPVRLVLDGPVAADDGGELGVAGRRAQISPNLAPRGSANISRMRK